MTTPTPPGLSRLNRATAYDAAALLREVCASAAWGAGVVGRRPYGSVEELLAASDDAMARLGVGDLREAVDGHPPIGRPAGGESAREQAGVAAGERAELLELNLAYQEVHGHVFLICATGASGAHIRAALRQRIGNDTATEREIVRAELGKINRIRLSRLVAPPQEDTPMTAATPDQPQPQADPHPDPRPHADPPKAPQATVSTHVLDTSAGRPAAGVPVALAVRAAAGAPWAPYAVAATDADGRVGGLPPLPAGTAYARLEFDVTAYAAQPAGPFFPEVSVAFAVAPGEHFHVPLLLNPFGYSVYRGS